MNIKKRGGALRGLRINREILILRKPPIPTYIESGTIRLMYLFCCFARGTKATGGATYKSPLLT